MTLSHYLHTYTSLRLPHGPEHLGIGPNSPLGPWRRRSATAVAASSRVDADSGRRVRGVADRSPKKLHEKNITTKHRRTLRGRPRSPPSPAPHPRAPSTRRTSTPTSPPRRRRRPPRAPPRHAPSSQRLRLRLRRRPPTGRITPRPLPPRTPSRYCAMHGFTRSGFLPG